MAIFITWILEQGPIPATGQLREPIVALPSPSPTDLPVRTNFLPISKLPPTAVHELKLAEALSCNLVRFTV